MTIKNDGKAANIGLMLAAFGLLVSSSPSQAAENCVWGDTIGGRCFQINYKDGELAYYEININRHSDPETLEAYKSCPTKEESAAGFGYERDDSFYPKESGDRRSRKLCTMLAPCKNEPCTIEVAKKEIKNASDENKYRLPEKRLDESGIAATVKAAVERAGVCPSGYEHQDLFDTHRNEFYLLAVFCKRKAECKEGFVRYRDHPAGADVGFSECRRYGDCPEKYPFRIDIDTCGSCSFGGCPDVSRSPPMCVVNMKRPEDAAHCKEEYRDGASQYRVMDQKKPAEAPGEGTRKGPAYSRPPDSYFNEPG